MEELKQAILSEAFLNGFWLFVGICAGAFVQVLVNTYFHRQGFDRARNIFYSEVVINYWELERLQGSLERLRDKISTGNASAQDVSISMRGFAYRSIDLLINSGHFHQIFRPETITKIFEFASALNSQNGDSSSRFLREALEHGDRDAAARHIISLIDACKLGRSHLEEISSDLRKKSPAALVKPKDSFRP